MKKMNNNEVAQEYATPEERRNAEEQKKQKDFSKKMVRKIVGRLILIVTVISAGLIYCYPFKQVKEDTIRRNLNNSEGYIHQISSEGHSVAWNSELPKFVIRDIALAKEKNYKIEYSYGSSTIYIYYSDGIPCLEIDSPYSWILSASFSEPLYNFSIYRSEDQQSIEIYGYHSPREDYFEKVVLYADVKKMPYSDTLSYDTNMPLSTDISDTIWTVAYGDYSMYVDTENSTFSFYKDGEVVSSKVFQDSIKEIYRYGGFVTTQNGLLYKMYVYEKNGIPDLTFRFIADDVNFMPVRYSSYASITYEDVSLPIVTKKGDDETLYVIAPNDWLVYLTYGSADGTISEYLPDQDYSMEILKLEDKFAYAEFSYNSYWKSKVSFKINNRICSATYSLDGYDHNISLSDGEKAELSIKVWSEKVMWEHIKKIRETYASYYDCAFSDLINSTTW